MVLTGRSGDGLAFRWAGEAMKFSLSNLLLVTALIAACIGWCVDRSRLATEVVDLNEECMQMMERATQLPSGMRVSDWRSDPSDPGRVYNFNIAADRATYRENYPSKFRRKMFWELDGNGE